jgi:hypothetical protein
VAARVRADDPRVAPLVEAYTDFHWGYDPEELIHVDDPILPDVAGIGRLIALHVGENGESELMFPQGSTKATRSYIAYDPAHPCDRIHLVVPKADRRKAAGLYRRARRSLQRPLADIAEDVGGRQARQPYPALMGVDLGVVKEVIYLTSKKGDGLSYYIHEFGEESGVRPHLAVDQDGRFWLLGGNYTCPRPGITD